MQPILQIAPRLRRMNEAGFRRRLASHVTKALWRISVPQNQDFFARPRATPAKMKKIKFINPLDSQENFMKRKGRSTQFLGSAHERRVEFRQLLKQSLQMRIRIPGVFQGAHQRRTISDDFYIEQGVLKINRRQFLQPISHLRHFHTHSDQRSAKLTLRL